MNKVNELHKNILINLEQLGTIFDHISNGITITDKNSVILYTNPGFTRITGYSKEEAKGENPGILHSGQHNKDFYAAMWQKVISDGFWEGEIWNRRKSGEVYPEYLTISKLSLNKSEEFCYVAIFSDISYLEKDVEKKSHLAFYDPLTELPNRNLYLSRFNQLLNDVNYKNDRIITVFYMDLNKFKQVNDTYGHLIGDKLLHLVGQRFKKTLRSGDTIARIGGDEFTAVLTTIADKITAKNFASRILESMEKTFMIENHQINISISIGICFYPQDGVQIDMLLNNADKAMYRAKKSGSHIEFYETEN